MFELPKLNEGSSHLRNAPAQQKKLLMHFKLIVFFSRCVTDPFLSNPLRMVNLIAITMYIIKNKVLQLSNVLNYGRCSRNYSSVKLPEVRRKTSRT